MSIARIVELKTMTIEELRLLWGNLYKTPPKSNSREFLVKRLSYRIQELKKGDDTGVADRLNALAAECSNKSSNYPSVPIGTVLIREYHGVEHQVASVAGSFEYNGQKFRSLSAIAKLITGMSWSGNAFFGLPKSSKRVKR